MKRAINPRILNTVKEISDDPIITDFLVEILIMESEQIGNEKRRWHYSDFYKQKIIESVAEYKDEEEGS